MTPPAGINQKQADDTQDVWARRSSANRSPEQCDTDPVPSPDERPSTGRRLET